MNFLSSNFKNDFGEGKGKEGQNGHFHQCFFFFQENWYLVYKLKWYKRVEKWAQKKSKIVGRAHIPKVQLKGAHIWLESMKQRIKLENLSMAYIIQN